MHSSHQNQFTLWRCALCVVRCVSQVKGTALEQVVQSLAIAAQVRPAGYPAPMPLDQHHQSCWWLFLQSAALAMYASFMDLHNSQQCEPALCLAASIMLRKGPGSQLTHLFLSQNTPSFLCPCTVTGCCMQRAAAWQPRAAGRWAPGCRYICPACTAWLEAGGGAHPQLPHQSAMEVRGRKRGEQPYLQIGARQLAQA